MTPDLTAPDDAKKRTPLENGGPRQGDGAKFFTLDTEDLTDDWPYHAVANTILAHSLLRSLPGVDANRTALTGISWGGYTACIAGSIDSRFKAVVPVYGCGFLRENSVWLKHFATMGPEKTERWTKLYDPSQYLSSCRVPFFFVAGTNDFAYPLDSYMKSFDLVTGPKNIRIEVKMKHDHPNGWKPAEIAAFIDSQLLGKPKLPLLDRPIEKDNAVTTTVHDAPIQSAELEFTTTEGPINQLEWDHASATLSQDRLSAPLPANARIYYFTVKTPEGLMVSSPVVIKK